MTAISCDLVPLTDLTGHGPRWTALSDEPWFELQTDMSLAGRWIALHWSAGLLDTSARPVIRCQSPTGPFDILLPAAPFGCASWIGFIPAETQSILISPTGTMGDFGFRLDRLALVSTGELIMTGLARAPRLTVIGLGAWMIGRERDSRDLARDALARRSLDTYPIWRARGMRSFEPDGIDGVETQEAEHLHIRLIVRLRQGLATAWRLITPLIADLDAGPHVNWSLVIVRPADSASDDADLGLPHPKVSICDHTTPLATLAQPLGDDDLINELPVGSRIAPLALAALAMAASQAPTVPLFYADSDTIGHNGIHRAPIFRSGYDPILLQSLDTLSPTGFWRACAVRSSLGPTLPAPSEADTATIMSRVLVSLPEGTPRSTAPLRPLPSPSPDVDATIIIPTRDRLDLLKACIDSLTTKTTGRWRVLIADNESREPATLAYFTALGTDSRIEIYPVPGPFNFSAICNAAAARATSPILVFLNNDTSIIRPDWLDQLKRFAVLPGIGAVGAKLLFPNGRVQHGGVVAGLGGRAGHFEHDVAESDAGYFGRGTVPHLVSAVTAACLAVERTKFEAVGGFDADHLPIDLNDVDLCFRLTEAGYSTLMNPASVLIHHESASRGRSGDWEARYAAERVWFRERWLHKLRADPHFSPNLSLYSPDPMLG